MNSHFHIAPSGLGVLVKCTYHYEMEQQHPDTSSDAAEYGTAAHWFAERQLNDDVVFVGEVAPNGVEIDHTIVQQTQDYILRCRERMDLPHGIEDKVSMDQFTPGMYGTTDFWAADYTSRTLYIDDLKFGIIPVEAYDNYTMAAYALGVMNKLGILGHEEQFWRVVMTIHQPRAWHAEGRTRSWVLNVSELRPFWNQITYTVEQVLGGQRVASTGRHCIYCEGRHGCEAYRKAADNCIEVAEQGAFIDHSVESMESAWLEIERAIELLKARKVGIEEQLTQRIKEGAYVSRIGLKQNYGDRQWARSEDEIKALGKLTRIPVVEEKLITPAEMERRGLDKSIVDTYTTRRPTSAKLKRLTGTSLTQRVFGNGTS